MSILIDNICKNFGNFTALNHVNLELKSGSLTALIGPSGSGKSTLLRIIAGLEIPDTGKVWLSGKDSCLYSVQSRNIGFVFQNYALFKTMTVYQNIAFGLELRSVPQCEIPFKVKKLIDLIQLQGLESRYPTQLSGGQRQRIAFARALAIQPKILLLDEPFGALDAKVRLELRTWLRMLHHQFSVTTILVTHDQQEAMEVADEIVIFKKGRIEQIGRPQEIYDVPATSFVTQFLGQANSIPKSQLKYQLDAGLSTNKISNTENSFSYFRSHQILINLDKKEDYITSIIKKIVYLNNRVILFLSLEEQELNLKIEISLKRFKKLRIQNIATPLYLFFLSI